MLTNKLFLISIAILIAATHQDCESIQNPSSIRASSTIFFNNYQTQGQALIKCEGGKCPNACVSTEICTALQGKVANGICYLCQPWQNCVQKINCILPNGYISGNTCVCAAGYYKIAGICLKESAVQHTKISQRGNLNSNGKIIQKINLNYIPDSLTGNNCAVCSQVLVVKVLKCSVSPTLSVVYVPNSKFQFQIEIDFKNQYYIPSISISVQLNPAYKDHFAASDLSQVVPISIDSSNSALSSNLGQLTFGYGSSLLQESRNVYNGIW